MAQIHRDGFTLLSGSESARSDRLRFNIVFVHGLRGHPRKTWTETSGGPGNNNTDAAGSHEGRTWFSWSRERTFSASEHDRPASPGPTDIFWPEEFLVPDIPQARIWTYGYNAGVIGGLFQAHNQNSISQHGRDLAVKLEREIANEDPLVFVAHGLGGIIVKHALHRSKACRERTRFIVFLGTPHRGSPIASWGQIASNLARVGLQDSNKRLLDSLEVNSEVLDNIHEEFKTIVSERKIRIHSFQESQGSSGMKGVHGKVVDDFSSKLDLPYTLETVESIDANHMRMARCSSKDGLHYRAISGVLLQFVRKELSATKSSIGPLESSSRKSLFIVPFSKDESFVGRETTLTDIDIKIQPSLADKHQRMALVGLGGIGKSQVAIEFAYRTQEHTPETSVFWIHASNANRFEQGYTEIAEKAQLPGREDPQVNVLQLVCRWLSDEVNGQWLMALDDVGDDSTFFSNSSENESVLASERAARDLERFLPQSSNGAILITSRNVVAATDLVGTFGPLIDVKPMAE